VAPGRESGQTAVSRGAFLARAGVLAAGLAGLSDALRTLGWLEPAYAAPPDRVRATMEALVAFVVPGGGEAGATAELIRTLDLSLPSRPPLSSTVAVLLDQTALAVRPGAARGRFGSPFANLSFRDKARVFERLEGLDSPELGSIRYLAGNLPGLAAFVVYSEAGVLDRKTRRLRGRPLGWSLSRYSGTADGRADLRGYFQGRRKAEP
jgi:hypothetical protein